MHALVIRTRYIAMYAINIDNLESTSQSLQGSSAHTQLKRVTRTTGSKLEKSTGSYSIWKRVSNCAIDQ